MRGNGGTKRLELRREMRSLRVYHDYQHPHVRSVLARVIGRRGAPTRLRSDNGSEFICPALQGWLPEAGATSIPVAPGVALGEWVH